MIPLTIEKIIQSVSSVINYCFFCFDKTIVVVFVVIGDDGGGVGGVLFLTIRHDSTCYAFTFHVHVYVILPTIASTLV